MSIMPSLPSGVTTDEWRRAIALMAATDTHGENTTLSPVMREQNVLTSAKKFEVYLREGR